MALTKSNFNLHMTPRDEEGNPHFLSTEDFEAVRVSMRIVDGRIRRFALSVAEGDITLREALQAAYMQGTCDAKVSLQITGVSSDE